MQVNSWFVGPPRDENDGFRVRAGARRPEPGSDYSGYDCATPIPAPPLGRRQAMRWAQWRSFWGSPWRALHLSGEAVRANGWAGPRGVVEFPVQTRVQQKGSKATKGSGSQASSRDAIAAAGMICRELPTVPSSARIFGKTRKSRLIHITKERRSDYSGATP